MITQLTQTKVTIDKNAILMTLTEFKENHIQEYKDAVKAYWEKAQHMADEFKISADNQRMREDNFNMVLTEPRDDTKEYDKLINMFHRANEQEFVLTTDEYDQIMEDSWGWRDTSKMSNSMYTARR